MDHRVRARLAEQEGLISRSQALSDGVDPRAFDRLVRDGELHRVRRGVYVDPMTASSAGAHLRQLLRDRAACLVLSQPFVRSHTTAALELGLPILLPPDGLTHVTERRHAVPVGDGTKHHVAPYRLEDLAEANGFRVLGMARTAVDIAREYGYPHGVVAFDSARRLGVGIGDLESVLTTMTYWPHVKRARFQLTASSAGSESVGESLARMLLYELGHRDAETQFGLTDGRVSYYADLRVGRHLIEFDGRQKYTPETGGGLATTAPGQVVWDEKRREDWFRARRLGMSRLTWADVFGAGRDAARQRLRNEIEATARLWGTDISDLDRFRVRRTAA